MRPRIFVGSSSEALRIARAVEAELADEFEVTVWRQGTFKLNRTALDSLLADLDAFDAGVFVLRPDDVVVSRGRDEPAVRDNVIFELGLFMGRFGRDRTFMISPGGLRLPSDLAGLITAEYDAKRSDGNMRAAVGPACTEIRENLLGLPRPVVAEPHARVRLDRAMSRMSKDLEAFFGGQLLASASDPDETGTPASVAGRIGPATVELSFGRIETCRTDEAGSVVALPANEYFDDECITDLQSSLGAFVQHAYGDRVDRFLATVGHQLRDLPSQRVERAERRSEESYGIGQTVLVELAPEYRVILVSATTERTGIGLRAEPHFLYAAIQGVFAKMNEKRLKSVSMPVLGSGHGGMPLGAAILFNLLAIKSVLLDDAGIHVRNVNLVVFEGAASDLPPGILRRALTRIGSPPGR
jgi:O-acetyl-ADP-ribose deacetylase (regulator of RNase III)